MNNYSGLVDVVIPVFNGEATIVQALQSVVAQGQGLIRKIIVIDDGSEDASAAAVISLGLQQVELVRTENQGVAAARNFGIALARAEWVAFIDADDLWEPGKLAAQLTAAANFGAGFVCGAINSQPVMPSCGITAAMLGRGNFVATSAVLVRREVLNQLKPVFTPGMAFAEDYLAWLKCLTVTPGYYLSETLVTYHLSEHPRYRWGQILKNLWRVNWLYGSFLQDENKPLKEKLAIQITLAIGSIRSILSIAKRFMKSHCKSQKI